MKIDKIKYAEIEAKLSECDPDYICDVLELSAQELLDAFPRRVEHHIMEEYDVEDYKEDNYDGPPDEEGWNS